MEEQNLLIYNIEYTMERHYLHIKVKSTNLWRLMVCMMALSVGSCSDEEMVSSTTSGLDSDIISFQVTSGITTATTRSGDDKTELDPLILRSTETDSVLYLHTYVAEECERATGDAVTTRMAEVNDVASFYTLNNSEGFGVQGNYWTNNTEGDVFMKTGTTAYPYEGTEIWSAKPVYYWPNNDTDSLRFYAYAPLSAKDELEALSMEDNEISFGYTVPTTTTDADAENQPDLMFAISASPCNKTTDNGYAPLNFRHALSAIKFAVSDVVGGTITNIKIGGVKGTGTCTYAYSDAAKDYAFSWTTSGDNCSYSQDFGYTTENKTSDTDDVVINNQTGYEDMTFMLIPQELTDNAYITITFERTKDDGDVDSDNGNVKVEVGEETTTFTLTGNINQTITEWKAGYEYIYTISTSSANWIYVFDVIGSEQKEDDDEPMAGTFSDSESSIIVNATVTETNNDGDKPYYKVKSYRYRANNPSTQEAVAWTAVPSEGKVTVPSAIQSYTTKYASYIDNLTIPYDTWLPDITTSGPGAANGSYTTYNVKFYEQIVVTDWDGDWDLKTREEIGTEDNPCDLSTVNGARSTANCYVVNAGGYYKFPLVYGNAIKNGSDNSTSYNATNVQTVSNYSSTYPVLTTFTDYQGNKITSPKITGASDAVLVWQDAYNMITDVRLVGDNDYDYVTFHVNANSLQQGNAVIAIRNSGGTIMWSWHIWATEYWTDEGSLTLGTDDVDVDAYDNSFGNAYFTVAPRNIGWCDAKKTYYLERTGNMVFTQEISGKTDKLDLKQRDQTIEYWIGNNTYYQFGRKDPIVGFMNSSSVVKYNFGNYPYEISPQTKTIQDGIKNPQILYVGANALTTNDDWLSIHYCNLWNNTTTGTPTGNYPSSVGLSNDNLRYFYSSVKTVYDPSPAGYMVPPVNFFKVFTNATANDNIADNTSYFNGYKEQTAGGSYGGFYDYYAYPGRRGRTKIPLIYLNDTGHRWYANNNVGAGNNFNPQIVYLWSSHIVYSTSTYSSYGLAVGQLEASYGGNFAYNYRFIGRRAMARPVRPIKEKINR